MEWPFQNNAVQILQSVETGSNTGTPKAFTTDFYKKSETQT